MNEQLSLAFSILPTGYLSVSLSIIPTKEDGSLNTLNMATANIASPTEGSSEAELVALISKAILDFRTAKGI